MINVERHRDDLRPVDWDRAMSHCSEPELRAIEELAAAYSDASQYRGVRAVGEAMWRQVQHERARRVAEQARIDVQAWAIDELEFGDAPADPVGDVSGLPSWSEISTNVGEE